MGNYQDYLKKMPVPLREIESTPVRQHMFGKLWFFHLLWTAACLVCGMVRPCNGPLTISPRIED
jgi:hypothetical protein